MLPVHDDYLLEDFLEDFENDNPETFRGIHVDIQVNFIENKETEGVNALLRSIKLKCYKFALCILELLPKSRWDIVSAKDGNGNNSLQLLILDMEKRTNDGVQLSTQQKSETTDNEIIENTIVSTYRRCTCTCICM